MVTSFKTAQYHLEAGGLGGGLWKRRGYPTFDPYVAPPEPSLDLPDWPEISWASLNPQPGEDLNTVLNRMPPVKARVVLPANTIIPMRGNQIADTNHYTVLAQYCMGLRGQGTGSTIIELEENSFGYSVNPPPPTSNGPVGSVAGLGVRLSSNSGTVHEAVSLSDLTIIGHQQLSTDGIPMVFQGFYEYQGNGTVIDNIEVFGLSHATGNSPNVGEQMGMSYYRTQNMIVNRLNFDGQGVSGSPSGTHGGRHITIQNSRLGGSHNSGVTNSYAGTASADNATGWMTYINNDINATGHRFTGINWEQCIGDNYILGNRINVTSDTMHDFDTSHIFIGSKLPESSTAQWFIEDNVVNHIGNADDRYKGALVISHPQKLDSTYDNTIPIENIHVKVAGATLSPLVFTVTTQGPPANFQIDPATQFLVIRMPNF